ncbi:MAG: ATP-binding cassette domain-containing protein [Alphaproteobacteria bacterium]|nr:ATP-binding cassette domain-containing protein [Alphaproteobacteria bacterium]
MTNAVITTKNLTIGYENKVLLEKANFEVKKGDIFVIMGGSGCGKSSLLKVLTGLIAPLGGTFDLFGLDFLKATNEQKQFLKQQTGILYQSGALFSSMTLFENVAMPLTQYTTYTPKTIDELVHLKLSLVGLNGYENYYPSEISGGMKKRAGFARALALDPKIVYFDEPLAGLDPISSARLDELMLEINANLGTTLVVVTHELQSIFTIANNSIFLDAQTRSVTAQGNPKDILKNPPNERVFEFLTRGKDNEKRTK